MQAGKANDEVSNVHITVVWRRDANTQQQFGRTCHPSPAVRQTFGNKTSSSRWSAMRLL